MCDWTAVELLDGWRERVLPDLERLGALDFRSTEDGFKATLQLKRAAVVVSITAWSTGMLELIALATDGVNPDPEVVTEQRDARNNAEALLDEWLQHLRRLTAVPISLGRQRA